MAKRVKSKYGTKYCQFGSCNKNKVPAVWTNSGIVGKREYACEAHKHNVDDHDDGYMTEADHQTWGRL